MRAWLTLALLGAAATAVAQPRVTMPPSKIALDALGTATYKGFQGGLYPGGSNTMPAAHRAAGITKALAVQPLDSTGAPDSGGKIVLLSVGMSNATMKFCQAFGGVCTVGSFKRQALADTDVDATHLVMVDGARSTVVADQWDSAADTQYDYVRDTMLAGASVTEAQVQVVWMENANATPSVALPSASADAYTLETRFGNTMRALMTRYPHLQMVFLSPRSYGGYATSQLNPEPYAYESGFTVKWLIESQITQMAGGSPDAQAGDLDYSDGTAPWVAWGPYFWANATTPNGFGVSWASTDYGPDGTHPSNAGIDKVGDLLLAFFKTSPFTVCWFLATPGTCQ